MKRGSRYIFIYPMTRMLWKEREIYFEQAQLVFGHIVAGSDTIYHFVYRMSIIRPVIAFLFLLQTLIYMGLLLILYQWNTILSFFILVCCLFPLNQLYQKLYDTGRTALSQVPTLRKLLLLNRFLAPLQIPAAFVTSCTINAVLTLLLLGS